MEKVPRQRDKRGETTGKLKRSETISVENLNQVAGWSFSFYVLYIIKKLNIFGVWTKPNKQYEDNYVSHIWRHLIGSIMI